MVIVQITKGLLIVVLSTLALKVELRHWHFEPWYSGNIYIGFVVQETSARDAISSSVNVVARSTYILVHCVGVSKDRTVLYFPYSEQLWQIQHSWQIQYCSWQIQYCGRQIQHCGGRHLHFYCFKLNLHETVRIEKYIQQETFARITPFAAVSQRSSVTGSLKRLVDRLATLVSIA